MNVSSEYVQLFVVEESRDEYSTFILSLLQS